MKKVGAVFSLFFFFSLWPSALGADEGGGNETPGPARSLYSQEKAVDAKGRKISVVNFDDALIEGKARGPDGFVLRSREASSGRSVLELRRDFRLETLADAFGGMPVVPNLP